jgi:hypothetical protein
LKRNQLEQKRHIQVQHLQTKLPEDPSDLQPFDREVHVHIRTSLRQNEWQKQLTSSNRGSSKL